MLAPDTRDLDAVHDGIRISGALYIPFNFGVQPFKSRRYSLAD
jgi:hypothetical protein